jgi:sugar/nucleoside kinase (ribokinase family)
MKQFDILTFGSITLDILIPLPEDCGVNIEKEYAKKFLKVPLGEKIKVEQSLTLCGGGAANSAVGFSKLGLNTAAFGVMGDKSNKGFLISHLKEAGVCTDYITFAKNQMSSFSVILNSHEGERTVFHRRTMSENFNRKVLLNAPNSRAIYISHLYDGPDNMLDALPDWKQKHNEIIGWNPGKTQFKKGFKSFEKIFPVIDILVLNVEEAELFTGLTAEKIKSKDYSEKIIGEKILAKTEVQTEFLSDVRKLANKFLKAGIKTIVITDGGRGAQVFSKKEHFYSPAQNTKRVDTLGAGDAFSTGIISAKLHGKKLKEQILWGNYASNSVIQSYGAQAGQLKLNEMKNLIN